MWVIHGDEDEEVAFEHGVQLHNAVPHAFQTVRYCCNLATKCDITF